MGVHVPIHGRRSSVNAYIPHPLTGWRPSLNASDAKAILAADVALRSLTEMPAAGLTATLTAEMTAREECIRSSIIENVRATELGLAWAHYMDRYGRQIGHEDDALTLGAAKQNTAAIELGARIRSGESCSLDDLLALHSVLLTGTAQSAIAGNLRNSQVWIGTARCRLDEASFVPPPPDRVLSLLSDLVDYLNHGDHTPVVKAAIVHAQFETIHPFADGNGRTGRALIQTVLASAGVSVGVVPISTALSRNRAAYYGALNDTHTLHNDINDPARSRGFSVWLNRFSDACVTAHQRCQQLTATAEEIGSRWQEASVSLRCDSSAARLLANLPSMPVLDASVVSEILSATPRAARKALTTLESVGILEQVGGHRNRRFIASDLVYGRGCTPTVVCGLRGQRTKQRCQLPRGHFGQHRYTPPPVSRNVNL